MFATFVSVVNWFFCFYFSQLGAHPAPNNIHSLADWLKSFRIFLVWKKDDDDDDGEEEVKYRHNPTFCPPKSFNTTINQHFSRPIVANRENLTHI